MRQPSEEEKHRVFYILARFVIRPLFWLLFRPHVTGREHVPPTGAVIFASNHLSFIDSIAIPTVAPRKVHYLAKAEYFTGTGVSGWFSRTMFSALGALPVERETHRAAQEALDTALAVLKDGEGFGIYPEGTRSRDGKLARGRPGWTCLPPPAVSPVCRVPAMAPERVPPGGPRRPRLHRLPVPLGEPLTFPEF